jgi:hypothetical protein
MSSRQFETFLARLYSDREFLEHFMRSPEGVTREAGLDHREQQAAVAIDRAGLLMAARSYELKRQAHRGTGWLRRTTSWLGLGISWLRRLQILQR